jgi:hypothetical protein
MGERDLPRDLQQLVWYYLSILFDAKSEYIVGRQLAECINVCFIV